MSQLQGQKEAAIRTAKAELTELDRERRFLAKSIAEKVKLQKSFKSASGSKSQISETNASNLATNAPSKKVKLNEDAQPPESQLQSKRQIQEAKKRQQAIRDRNRRVFGGLNSHLKKAESRLKSLQETEKKEIAREVMKKVVEKEREESQHFKEEKAEKIQSELKELKERRQKNTERLIKAESKMLKIAVSQNFSNYSSFFMTRQEPQVFWKPTKPIEGQKDLKAETTRILNEKQSLVSKLIQDFQKAPSCFSSGNFLTQNERQFYKNYCNSLYSNHMGFWLTKTEPRVFWKTCKPYEANLESQLRERTQCALKNRCEEWIERSQEHYLQRMQKKKQKDHSRSSKSGDLSQQSHSGNEHQERNQDYASSDSDSCLVGP